jgi:hypothetical protein
MCILKFVVEPPSDDNDVEAAYVAESSVAIA